MANPKKGTVESLVKYWVARGRDLIDIISRVSAKFKRVSTGRITKAIDKYAKELNKNILPPRVKELTERQQAQLAKTGFTKGFRRATVDVVWISPGSRKIESGTTIEGTWYVDIPVHLSGQELQRYVRNALYQRFNEQYGGTIATLSQVSDFILSMELRELE